MHINDNYSKSDEHMFPFHGSVDWWSIMPVLVEIGYEGDFPFETHKAFNGLPEPSKDSMAKIGYDIGRHCLTLTQS